MLGQNDLKYTLSLKDLFSKGLDKAISGVEKLDKLMGKSANGNGMFGSMLKANLVADGIERVGSAMLDFGKDSIRAYKQNEQFNVALKTMLHGNAQEAKALSMQLVGLAQKTPFELTEIQGATRQMVAYGFQSKEVVKNLTMLGDVSSGVAAPIEDIVYLYGTLKTQGKVFSKDLYQFANRGIPIIGELAKHFKVADSEIFEMAKDGKIGFADIESAFKQMTGAGGQFFGMMDEQSKTLAGKTSNLGDAWEQLKVKIAGSQRGILVSTVDWATRMVAQLNRGFAASDMAQNALDKYGANNYSALDKFARYTGGDITGKTRIGADNQYQDSLNQEYITPAQESLSQAMKSNLALSNILVNVYKDKDFQKNDRKGFDRTVAILKGSRDEVQDLIKGFKQSEGIGGVNPLNQLKKDSEAAADTKVGGTEISGNRPQNMYINITKLVETLNINTTNLKESAGRIKEEVAKALLETVNDANLLAR